jgi:hypothetical protein
VTAAAPESARRASLRFMPGQSSGDIKPIAVGQPAV